MIRHRWIGAVAASLISLAPVGAQVPTIALDKGGKELTETFTNVSGLVELRDGRVLVSDMMERSLSIVDITRDTHAAAARAGAGPKEIKMGVLLIGAADSALFYDMEQHRMLVFSPTGAPANTRPFGVAPSANDPFAMFGTMQPRQVDAKGRMYGQGMGMKMPTMAEIEKIATTGGTPPAPSFLDSVYIERIDPATGRTDTLGRVRNIGAASQPKMQMTGAIMKMTMRMPDLRASDLWTALPDGRVAVLRDGKYQVEFVTSRQSVTRGPMVPHTPIPVTAAEKQAAIDSARASLVKMQEIMTKSAGHGGADVGGMPKMDVELLEPVAWAQNKPAYISLMASPDGRLWVQTSTPFTQKAKSYDVLDGTGKLIARVRLAAGETVVGLGRGTVYTTRTDADDLLYLRRYTLPAPLQPR
jgi:hypothetical protein